MVARIPVEVPVAVEAVMCLCRPIAGVSRYLGGEGKLAIGDSKEFGQGHADHQQGCCYFGMAFALEESSYFLTVQLDSWLRLAAVVVVDVVVIVAAAAAAVVAAGAVAALCVG
jgi:hypothetical protein